MFLIIYSFFIFVSNYVVFCKFVSNSYIIIVTYLNIKMSQKKVTSKAIWFIMFMSSQTAFDATL